MANTPSDGEEFFEAVHLTNAYCDVVPSEQKYKLQNVLKENENSFVDQVQNI
jgi:hypothetical protein